MCPRPPGPFAVTLLLGAALSLPGAARGDPLDGVSGMESWKNTKVQSVGDDWKDWFKARIALREGYREMRIQRIRNRRLAAMIQRSAPPDMARMRKVVTSTVSRSSGGRRGDRGPAAPPDDRDPPNWIKVPVERLDESGQAIDDEGDRELRRVYRKRRRR